MAILRVTIISLFGDFVRIGESFFAAFFPVHHDICAVSRDAPPNRKPLEKAFDRDWKTALHQTAKRKEETEHKASIPVSFQHVCNMAGALGLDGDVEEVVSQLQIVWG